MKCEDAEPAADVFGNVEPAANMLVHSAAQIQPNVAPYDSYTARTCCNGPMESLKWILKQQSAPSETAAIIVEPIMGEGGFLTPPPSFLPTLRKVCDEHGIVLIIDEVITPSCLLYNLLPGTSGYGVDGLLEPPLMASPAGNSGKQAVLDGLAGYCSLRTLCFCDAILCCLIIATD